jgi:hypothetical protein
VGASVVIDVAPFDRCVCDRMVNAHDLCEGALTLSERGKKVRLSLRPGEQAKAIVIDGCVLQDNHPKCDGLFLFLGNHRAAALLVELKGTDIQHAFEQLKSVRECRREYANLIERLRSCGQGRVTEKAFVVSSRMVSKPEHERWENQVGIRVTAILHSEAASPIPDLRAYL